MTRVMTINDYLLDELNRRMRARGEDIELVFERPKPELIINNGDNVVKLPGVNLKGTDNA